MRKLVGNVWVVIAVGVLCGFQWPLSFGELTWDRINSSIAENYPEVAHLSTDDLSALISEGRPLLLVDVRESEEYLISHIPGAVHVDSFNDQKRNDANADTMIVGYCSVGLRSAKFINELRKAGFIKVYNLRGSIFEWANRGMDLVGSKGSTLMVHPYNTRWGRLLKSELHQYPQ